MSIRAAADIRKKGCGLDKVALETERGRSCWGGWMRHAPSAPCVTGVLGAVDEIALTTASFAAHRPA